MTQHTIIQYCVTLQYIVAQQAPHAVAFNVVAHAKHAPQLTYATCTTHGVSDHDVTAWHNKTQHHSACSSSPTACMYAAQTVWYLFAYCASSLTAH